MKKLIFTLLLLATINFVFAQNKITIKIADANTTLPLQGVSVGDMKAGIGGTTNERGELQLDLHKDSTYHFGAHIFNYDNAEQTVIANWNNNETKTIKIFLEPKSNKLTEVRISANRTNDRIEDVPQKIEVIGTEEMNEESTLKPGNVASLLGDLSVIHIQQTSAVNGNSVIRLQGLDGQYTQLMRDGLPMYEGFSGSFGLLSIPPLDLKQAEIIKGSASTLFGGGAIAGVINLVSKEPTDSLTGTLLVNQSTLKETNLNFFVAKRNKYTGFTFFGGQNFQQAVDVNKDGFSDVPYVKQTVLHPKFFIYPNKKITIIAGLNAITESRIGGDMQAINQTPDSLHPFYENNQSTRLAADYKVMANEGMHHFILKGIVSWYDRSVTQSDTSGSHIFKGEQTQNFAEASDMLAFKNQKLVYGVAYNSEHFVNKFSSNDSIQSYLYTTVSAFVQHTWNITPKFLTEAGFRFDNHSRYGNFYLPRLSLFYRPNKKFSVRVGGGSGYKNPAMFSKQTLDYRFNQITFPNANVKPENSLGVNADINFHSHIGKVLVSIDQAFYHTQITDAVMVKENPNYFISFYNYNGQIKTDGTDTYVRLKLEELEWYFGLNHTIGKYSNGGTSSFVPYFPQDKISSTMAYEIEAICRVGLEASYQANQYINQNANDIFSATKTHNYWFFAMMIAKDFKWGSLVLNCENLGNYRQSKIENLYTGTIQNPQFKGIWAPIDGRIVNLSLKVNL